MSSRNDNTAGSGLAIVGGILGVMAIAMLMILAFLSFAATVLCLLAWKKPLTLGKWTLEPDDAHAFVGRGLIGSSLLLGFALFSDLLFGIGINWNYWLHIMGAGYVGGSIGIEILKLQGGSEQPQADIVPPTRQIPAPEQRIAPTTPSEREPFQFATWDDEEERR